MIALILDANCGYHSSSATFANSGYISARSSYSHAIAVCKFVFVSQNFIIVVVSISMYGISTHSFSTNSCIILNNHSACSFSCSAVSKKMFAICKYHAFLATLA
jgi:hypothetical protein